MGAVDIVTVSVTVLVVAAVAVYRKIKGKEGGTCGCGCEGCSFSGRCHGREGKNK